MEERIKTIFPFFFFLPYIHSERRYITLIRKEEVHCDFPHISETVAGEEGLRGRGRNVGHVDGIVDIWVRSTNTTTESFNINDMGLLVRLFVLYNNSPPLPCFPEEARRQRQERKRVTLLARIGEIVEF